jgi:benzoate-CoA ligase family protein
VNEIDRSASVVEFFLDRHIEGGRGDVVAVRTRQETLTYLELHQLSCRISRAFREAGARPGDRIAFVLPDSPFYIAAIFGAIRLGAIAVPLSTRLAPQDYAEILDQCSPRLVLLSEEHLNLIDNAPRQRASECRFWCASNACTRPDIEPLLPLVQASSAEVVDARLNASAAALIQFTSGSTGRAKGVVHRHENVVAIKDTIVRRLDLRPNDVCYSTAKLPFGYGFGNSVLLPFSVGASSIVDGKTPDVSTVHDIAQKLQPSILFSTPGLYGSLLHLRDSALQAVLFSIRLCVSAGEQLGSSIFRRWKTRTGHEIVDGIGSTECLHIFISTIPGSVREDTTGRPVPCCQARVLDYDGRPAPDGTVGELWIQNPCNSQGYWQDAASTAKTMQDGLVRTGDLFSRDELGDYRFSGRADDIVKVGGLKVLPYEVEQCLLSHPAVSECCVVGAKTDNDITVLVAHVVLETGYNKGTEMAIALNRYLANYLAPHKLPSRFHFVANMPRSVTGKLDRNQLVENYSRTIQA